VEQLRDQRGFNMSKAKPLQFQTLPEDGMFEDGDEEVSLAALYLAHLDDGRVQDLLTGVLTAAPDGQAEVGSGSRECTAVTLSA
jgi:hypothetical protein